MYYAVACFYYGSCIGYLKSGHLFLYVIDRFAHYFRLAFNYAYTHHIFLKQIKSVGKVFETSLYIINCIKDILKMFQNIFIIHKSSVSYG